MGSTKRKVPPPRLEQERKKKRAHRKGERPAPAGGFKKSHVPNTSRWMRTRGKGAHVTNCMEKGGSYIESYNSGRTTQREEKAPRHYKEDKKKFRDAVRQTNKKNKRAAGIPRRLKRRRQKKVRAAVSGRDQRSLNEGLIRTTNQKGKYLCSEICHP